MIKNYIKIAWRNLVKDKLYTFINVTGLAIGIAAVLVLILYIQHEFSFDNYHEKGDRIYRITAYSGFNEKSWQSYSPGDPVEEMRANFVGVEDAVRMTSCSGGDISVGDRDYPDVDIYCTESSLFNIFSFPLIGGLDVLDAPFTAVISRSTAIRVFGEENAIGRSISFNWDGGKKDFEVTGIMEDIPTNTHFRYDVFLSYESLKSTNRCLDCGQQMYTLLEESIDTAAIADMLLDHIREINGKSYVDDIRLQPLEEIHFSDLYAQRKGDWQYIQIISAIALVILLVGCCNYMNLSTARYSNRSREIGIRKVAGAYRIQLVRQFFVETLLVTLAATPLAFLLIELSVPWFNIYAGTELSLSLSKKMSFVFVSVCVLLLTGVVAGSYPALYLSSFNPREVLQLKKKTGLGATALRKSLVIFQFFASSVIIIAVVIILQQLDYIFQQNLGFDSDRVVSITINDPFLYEQGDAVKQEFLRQNTVEAATGSIAPVTGRFAGISHTFTSDSIPDKKYTFVTPRIDSDFLETMDMNLLAGQNISSVRNEEHTSPADALINLTGVKALGFTDYNDILGEIVAENYRIAGVVEDFHLESLQHEIKPALLVPNPFNTTHVVNVRLSGGSIQQGIDDLHTAWTNLGATTPLDYTFLDELIQQQYQQELRTVRLIGAFAGLSVFIACMGLFGLAAFTTRQRSREIGIRKVLGATVASIAALLSKDFIKLVLIGFVIAVPIAWYAMNRWLEDFAYRIEIGPGVFLLAGLAAVAIALATVSWQSVKAAVANPAKSLRTE